MANDRRQVELERELRKLGYAYLRKRQAKSEARRFIGQHYTMVTKEELAQAVAACELDPEIVRSEGKEGLPRNIDRRQETTGRKEIEKPGCQSGLLVTLWLSQSTD
jgi:hypothetical protein